MVQPWYTPLMEFLKLEYESSSPDNPHYAGRKGDFEGRAARRWLICEGGDESESHLVCRALWIGALLGVAHLHVHGVAHLDLGPENMVVEVVYEAEHLDRGYARCRVVKITLKITDFGQARRFEEDDEAEDDEDVEERKKKEEKKMMLTEKQGKMDYWAPEVHYCGSGQEIPGSGGAYSAMANDVWCVAMTCLFMMLYRKLIDNGRGASPRLTEY